MRTVAFLVFDFAAELGTTPAVYVEKLRLEAARRLLESSDLTVETIAKTVGMSLPETLYRAFRRRLGTTPDQYRQHWNNSTRRRQSHELPEHPHTR